MVLGVGYEMSMDIGWTGLSEREDIHSQLALDKVEDIPRTVRRHNKFLYIPLPQTLQHRVRSRSALPTND